jgi:hypothetical protein
MYTAIREKKSRHHLTHIIAGKITKSCLYKGITVISVRKVAVWMRVFLSCSNHKHMAFNQNV